jgi:S-DNA-T family DNA segregation ATPase FtsK/SpoIIIE
VGIDGVTIVSMPQVWRTITSPTTVRLVIHPAAAGHSETIEINTEAGSEVIGIPDHLGILQAEAIARRLAGMAFGDQTDGPKPQQTADPERSKDLMELLKISDIRQFDPAKDWKHRSGRDRLNVPFGITQTGIPTMIDLKESAEQGMGPHGLMIGATGSGKSEVLRTMVLALALTHSPEQLNLVLVDFKGGATFAGMAQLPHVSAMISNLAAELSLVDRMEEALRGEMNRRQELLRAAGNFANVNDYEAARRAGRHGYPTLPALFIVLDEFSELLSANPEFIDTFVTIGRLGRSMSIHLLLASQRLEEGRLRGLDSHLSYRIGLRTFSGHESRAVLGVEDAYKLPSLPGVGYLKIGSAEGMIRFRASYVAAPPPPPSRTTAATAPFAAPPRVQILPFTSTRRNIQPSSYPEPAIVLEETRLPLSVDPWEGMSELAIAVQRMEGHGQAHQIWLPPLDTPDTFASLMPDLAVIPGGGLLSMETRSKGWLQLPMGTVDVPLEQRREPLVFDLSGAAGNLVVVGAPLTGKSTFLRTLAISLSLTYTPREVQFYILDLGGGTFSPFSKALHVAAVATRDTPDVINRMFAEIEGIMADREAYFRTHGIDSMATYRQGRAEGKYDDGYGDVFVIVDGWTVVRTDFPDLEMRVSALAVRALTFGIHLVFSANRWADVRQALQDVMSSRFELRLGQPHESQVNRRLAEAIPLNRPGRGIVTSKHHALIALPRIDDDPSPATLGQGVVNTLQRIADAWQGPPPPKLRLLPEKVTLAELRAQAPASPQFLIGIEESRLSPLLFNPAEENHLFAFGDGGTGRSNFLRCLAQEIMRTNSPNQAQIYLVDPRRALLGEIPDAYRAGYYTTREAATEGLTALSAYLKNRLPRADVTPAQLRDRSWWTGAEGWILVDDYELIANPSTHPLAALQPLMAQARDLGFHIVVVRRMGGASRAMYDPIIQTMSELGSTGILLPGDPGEGQLIGRHKPMKGVPGRAQVISRAKGHAMAQLAWADQAMD